jgi:hypothetical protein
MILGGDPRRRTIVLLGAALLLVLTLLGGLQAFNTQNVRLLNPESAGETLLFAGLTVLVFLLLLLLLVLLLRTILKVYASGSSSALGAQLRSRMVMGAILIALIPAVFMFLFSYLLLNRSLDRWFSSNTSELREDATRVIQEMAKYVTDDARGEAESIASNAAADRSLQEVQQVLASRRITLFGGFAVVFNKDHHVITSFQAPAESSSAILLPWLEEGEQGAAIALHGPLSEGVLATAQRTDEPVLKIDGHEFVLGTAVSQQGNLVVVALPMPQGLSQTVHRIRSGAASYRQLFPKRNQIRTTFFLMLLLITVFVFFTSVWLAVFLSKQITQPVEALALAMDEIASGQYHHRVELMAAGEMGDLVRAFNHMAADLEASRRLVESSSAQLTAANLAAEARRREMETIVETIPSGVVTLDSAGVILQCNHAFTALLGLEEDALQKGTRIQTLVPAECVDDLSSVIRRGQRMGAASVELEFSARGRIVHLAVTSARLELVRGKAGAVLVIEDTTELLRAQRQMAWKEVAQRVAHEIKNPLTPIALSAERISRHLDRQQPDSNLVIRKCSEVILGCVATLRTLVDQFSALAQFPAPRPRPCDLHELADAVLNLFTGRLEGITIERAMDEELPTVMADPEAIRRALANLIDNAADAMQGSLLRVLTVGAHSVPEAEAVDVWVADTGHGLTDEIRERLFLPFYSTKRRGTGLGLSIAAKIAQEHGGSLRAESNLPKGARFILRLPLVSAARSESEVAALPAAAVTEEITPALLESNPTQEA